MRIVIFYLLFEKRILNLFGSILIPSKRLIVGLLVILIARMAIVYVPLWMITIDTLEREFKRAKGFGPYCG